MQRDEAVRRHVGKNSMVQCIVRHQCGIMRTYAADVCELDYACDVPPRVTGQALSLNRTSYAATVGPRGDSLLLAAGPLRDDPFGFACLRRSERV